MMRLLTPVLAFPALCRGGGFSLGFGASEHEDVSWAPEFVKRYGPLSLALIQQDSPCSDSGSVGKDQCLGKGAMCMWLKTDKTNHCLPCEWEGIDIPCSPVKTMWGGALVEDCVMNCDHQKTLSVGSECTDVSGSISTTQCFQKGASASGGDGEPCMWTAYTTKNGEGKSICGPCVVGGIGTIPCYNDGDKGPEGGSLTDGCATQCDLDQNDVGVPCDSGTNQIPAVQNCFNTPAPPPPSKGTLPLEVLKIPTKDGAPEYFAAAVDPPYGPRQYTEAAAMAATAAGWGDPIPLPPDAAVVIYGPPPKEGPTLPPTLKVVYGPAPPGIPGIPPPGYGYGTVPPAANVKAAAAQNGLLQMPTGGTTPPPGAAMQPVVVVESQEAVRKGAPLLHRSARGGSIDLEGLVADESAAAPVRTIQ